MVITAETRTVTFQVAALLGGARFTEGHPASFELVGEKEPGTPERTIIRRIQTDEGLQFPLFVLDWDRGEDEVPPFIPEIPSTVARGDTIMATYTFLSTCNEFPVGNTIPPLQSMTPYLPGMFIRVLPSTNANRAKADIQATPRYIFAGQTRTLTGEPALIDAEIFLGVTGVTTATPAFIDVPLVVAPLTAPLLQNTIGFRFTTRKANPDVASIASFNFQVPIFPIDATAGTWFIRNGFGTGNFDLDNGSGGRRSRYNVNAS
jgi:hypothetical protein